MNDKENEILNENEEIYDPDEMFDDDYANPDRVQGRFYVKQQPAIAATATMEETKKLDKNSDEYGTPDNIFEELDRRYRFTIDAAATAENAKCDNYWDKERDALRYSWAGFRVFANPPYSNGNCKKFALKAFEETAKGCPLAVLIMPTKTEQAWFHELRNSGRVEVKFFKKRIKFVGGVTSARDSHMLLIIWPPTNLFS